MGRLRLHLYKIQQNWSTIELKSTFLLCFKNLNLLYLNFLNEKNINYKFLNYLILKKLLYLQKLTPKQGDLEPEPPKGGTPQYCMIAGQSKLLYNPNFTPPLFAAAVHLRGLHRLLRWYRDGRQRCPPIHHIQHLPRLQVQVSKMAATHVWRHCHNFCLSKLN